jgi:hypothetical protein
MPNRDHRVFRHHHLGRARRCGQPPAELLSLNGLPGSHLVIPYLSHASNSVVWKTKRPTPAPHRMSAVLGTDPSVHSFASLACTWNHRYTQAATHCGPGIAVTKCPLSVDPESQQTFSMVMQSFLANGRHKRGQRRFRADFSFDECLRLAYQPRRWDMCSRQAAA